MKLSKEEHDGFTEATEALDDHIADDSKKVEEWIRFDPEDKKTFPKKYPVLVHLDYGGIEICTLFFDGKFQTGVGDSFAPEKITHWRPLPGPPQEVVVSKTETTTVNRRHEMKKNDIVDFLRWKIRKLNIERNQSEFLIKTYQDRIREIDLERDEAKHELRNQTGEDIE